MELKTQVVAEKGTQEIKITREFNLPVELLFKAYTETDLFEEWMGTKLVKFNCNSRGSYRFETSDPNGNVVFSANGVFHEVLKNERITRTFEMENSTLPVQLEFLEFEELTEKTSKLSMQMLFRSVAFRDQLMQRPFAQGLNFAHNRLEEVVRP